jgi:VanZ family protein
MQAANPELRFKWLWLLIGYGSIVLVVYLSLVSDPVSIANVMPLQDKVLHMIAYFFLAFWFVQIYHVRQHMMFWLAFFLCLGLLMEYLQGLGAARYSEVGDMVANMLGVAIALVLSKTRLRYMLVGFERLLGR